MTALEVFQQNDGKVTKAYYAELDSRGSAGRIATALFRCQKRSTAAKRYRGGRYRRASYDVKNWSLEQLCLLLHTYASALGITWGWKTDPRMKASGDPHDQVLYIDLNSFHQVSFHSSSRYVGGEYAGEWDGCHKSEERILRFCDQVMRAEPIRTSSELAQEGDASDSQTARPSPENPNSTGQGRVNLNTVPQELRPLRNHRRVREELERGNGRLAL